MPSTSRTRVAAVALVSTALLIPLSAEAAAAKAKSTHPRARATTISRVLQSSGVGGYLSGAGMGAGVAPLSRGVVNDNTAGWGNVGAF